MSSAQQTFLSFPTQNSSAWNFSAIAHLKICIVLFTVSITVWIMEMCWWSLAIILCSIIPLNSRIEIANRICVGKECSKGRVLFHEFVVLSFENRVANRYVTRNFLAVDRHSTTRSILALLHKANYFVLVQCSPSCLYVLRISLTLELIAYALNQTKYNWLWFFNSHFLRSQGWKAHCFTFASQSIATLQSKRKEEDRATMSYLTDNRHVEA